MADSSSNNSKATKATVTTTTFTGEQVLHSLAIDYRCLPSKLSLSLVPAKRRVEELLEDCVSRDKVGDNFLKELESLETKHMSALETYVQGNAAPSTDTKALRERQEERQRLLKIADEIVDKSEGYLVCVKEPERLSTEASTLLEKDLDKALQHVEELRDKLVAAKAQVKTLSEASNESARRQTKAKAIGNLVRQAVALIEVAQGERREENEYATRLLASREEELEREQRSYVQGGLCDVDSYAAVTSTLDKLRAAKAENEAKDAELAATLQRAAKFDLGSTDPAEPPKKRQRLSFFWLFGA